jgi:hypothetical protein
MGGFFDVVIMFVASPPQADLNRPSRVETQNALKCFIAGNKLSGTTDECFKPKSSVGAAFTIAGQIVCNGRAARSAGSIY